MHANKTKTFNLSNYTAQPKQKGLGNFTVGIPKLPFCIVDAQLDPVYVAFISKRWWLVHKEIAQATSSYCLHMAELYLYVLQDGTKGVLPVTLPKPSSSTSWYEAWQDIVRDAKRNWVTVVHNDELRKHEHEIVAPLKISPPLSIPKEEWVARAINSYVIDSYDHIYACQFLAPRSSHNPDESELSEEVDGF